VPRLTSGSTRCSRSDSAAKERGADALTAVRRKQGARTGGISQSSKASKVDSYWLLRGNEQEGAKFRRKKLRKEENFKVREVKKERASEHQRRNNLMTSPPSRDLDTKTARFFATEPFRHVNLVIDPIDLTKRRRSELATWTRLQHSLVSRSIR
jgi:hypothetical protein